MITVKKSEYNKAKLRKLFREASQQYIQITEEEAEYLGLIPNYDNVSINSDNILKVFDVTKNITYLDLIKNINFTGECTYTNKKYTLKEICFLDNNNTTFILLDNETHNLITYNGKYLFDTNDNNIIKIFENDNSENYLFRITTYIFNFNDLLINFSIIINNKNGGNTDFGGSALFIGNRL